MSHVLVPARRFARWVENFSERHDGCTMSVTSGCLAGVASDGSRFTAYLPFALSYDAAADVDSFTRACAAPAVWGVLLVRKGGFAIARLEGERTVESKVGQRHVQGRTKAGGQSQQRFARRRENQARVAYEAAAEHAARILSGVGLLVTGGDHSAVEAVLSDRRLSALAVAPPFLPVPDPRRAVLDKAVTDAGSVRVEVTNA